MSAFVNRTFSMTAKQAAELERYSAETGIPKSVVIRLALAEFFADKARDAAILESARRRARR